MHPKINGKITDRISINRIGLYCVHRTMRVEGVNVNGAPADLLLHTTDTIRQLPIERGLTDKERLFCGNIEIPAEVFDNLQNQNKLIRDFIAKYLFNIRHTKVAVYARKGRIRIVGYTFEWKFEQ